MVFRLLDALVDGIVSTDGGGSVLASKLGYDYGFGTEDCEPYADDPENFGCQILKGFGVVATPDAIAAFNLGMKCGRLKRTLYGAGEVGE